MGWGTIVRALEAQGLLGPTAIPSAPTTPSVSCDTERVHEAPQKNPATTEGPDSASADTNRTVRAFVWAVPMEEDREH
jgi:hypothetical protein